MANELTGDFDIVAQFAVPTANRVLAAMHRIERFPHAMSLRVEDTRSPFPDRTLPVIVATIDAFGDPVSNQDSIRNPNPFPGLRAATDAMLFAFDPVVNLDNAGILDEPIVPSNLKGRAQLQLFAPTIEVADSSGTNVHVNLQVLSRYFPDKNTPSVAEFVRGDLRLTVPVHQVASQDARVVEIDIKARTVGVSFNPIWSSKPLTAQDLTAINNLIRNALKTSFVPSTSTLPADISHLQFKTQQGSTNVLSALLNTSGVRGNRNSATNVFIGTGDDFAVGVSAEYVQQQFQPTLDAIKNTPIEKTWTYTIVLKEVFLELRAGVMVLVLKGRATSPSWWRPNFNFTVKQQLRLAANGDSADLVLGSLSVDTDDIIIDRFRGLFEGAIKRMRDGALAESGANGKVREMLSARRSLGGFLDSLLTPARRRPGLPTGLPPRFPAFNLTYSSAEIRPVGLVLRGSLAVRAWPPVHAEFQRISSSSSGPSTVVDASAVNQGPDYSALKSWVPGGTVLRYEWRSQTQGVPSLTEENKFVYLRPPPVFTEGETSEPALGRRLISAFAPMCLTVHGSRLTAAGPVVRENVSATSCGLSSFPIFGALDLNAELAIAIPQRGIDGLVDVAGITLARGVANGGSAPNLLVHFGDERSSANLGNMIRAIEESGRDDVTTAFLAVMTPENLAKAPYVEGVTYAEDRDGAWQRKLGVRTTGRPLTAIVDPRGKVLWQHEGDIEHGDLAATLKKTLVAGAPVSATIDPSAVRIGHTSPNFLFEYTPGHQVTLRKISGRPAVLAFWRSTSRQSIESIRELERTIGGANDRPVVLAINDGEPAELAKKIAADNKLTSTVVPDATRKIARAYGVDTWPTTIWLDESGLVRSIRIGRLNGQSTESPFVQTQAAYARKGQ